MTKKLGVTRGAEGWVVSDLSCGRIIAGPFDKEDEALSWIERWRIEQVFAGVSKWEREVSTEVDGRKYTARFHTDEDMVHVSYGGRRKSTQLGGHAQNPKLLAEILLRELVGQAHRDR